MPIRTFSKDLFRRIIGSFARSEPFEVGDFNFLIITYYARFENFCRIVQALHRWYPNQHVLVFVNGRDDDEEAHQAYCENMRAFLQSYPNVHAVYKSRFTPQTRLWNEGILASSTEHILILNDSIKIFGPFLKHSMFSPYLTKFNGSFSNYMITKELIARIGWFDEHFIAGASETDGDMEVRMYQAGLTPRVVSAPLIRWQRFDNVRTWSKKLGGVGKDRKTSNYNHDYFLKKWNFSQTQIPESIYVPIVSGYVSGPNSGFETPNPYPDVLQDLQERYRTSSSVDL